MFEKEKLLTAVLPVRQRPPEKNTRHIVYAADQNYIRHIGTSMLSVLENNHFPIHFHLLVSGSESYDFSIFNHLETINPNYAVTVYHLNTEYFTTLQTNGYFTIAMYYRMCIPAILGGISDTALYLDTDVLCLGDISELFTIDLTGQLVAAAPDTIFRAYICKLNPVGFNDTAPYFNSGVLLFNIQNWNDSQTDNILQNKIEAVENANIRLSCPDQDILNLTCINKIRWLPDTYNWIHWQKKAYELNKNPNAIKLVHFTGHVKPWHVLGFHPIYDRYYQKSPWNEGYIHQPLNTWLPFPKPYQAFKQAAKRLSKQGDKKQAWAYYKEYLLRKLNPNRFKAPDF